MYPSAYNGGAILRHPYIFSLVNYDAFTHPKLLAFIATNMLTRDLYLSPQGMEREDGPQLHASKYGITVPLAMKQPKTVGQYTFTFEGFQVPPGQRVDMMDGKSFDLGSIIKIQGADGKAETIVPTNKIVSSGESSMRTITTKSGDKFTVTDVHVDNQTHQASVDLAYMPARNSPDMALLKKVEYGSTDQNEALVIQATIKPFINLVWGGVVVMVIGFIVTWRRRREELLKEPV